MKTNIKEKKLFKQYEKSTTEEEKENIRIELGMLPSKDFWEKVSKILKSTEKNDDKI